MQAQRGINALENVNTADAKLRIEVANHSLQSLRITGVNSELRNQLITQWKENDRCEIRTTNS